MATPQAGMDRWTDVDIFLRQDTYLRTTLLSSASTSGLRRTLGDSGGPAD